MTAQSSCSANRLHLIYGRLNMRAEPRRTYSRQATLCQTQANAVATVYMHMGYRTAEWLARRHTTTRSQLCSCENKHKLCMASVHSEHVSDTQITVYTR